MSHKNIDLLSKNAIPKSLIKKTGKDQLQLPTIRSVDIHSSLRVTSN